VTGGASGFSLERDRLRPTRCYLQGSDEVAEEGEGGGEVPLGAFRQSFADFPIVPADGEHPGPRRPAVELAAQRQNRGRGEGVRREREARVGLDRSQVRGRFSRPGRVGKDDRVTVPDGEGVLDAQLIAELGADAGSFADDFRELRPQAVIAAAGIADPENEDRQRDLDSIVRPAASTISTVSGIAPRACVAQLRHGS